MGLLNSVRPFVVGFDAFYILDVFSNVCQEWIVFRLFGVQLRNVVAHEFRYHEVHVCQILQTSAPFLYEVVKVLYLWLHFLPNSFQFAFVFLVVEQNVCLLYYVEYNTINAGHYGLVLMTLSQQFWLRGNLNQIPTDRIQFSKFEIAMSQPWQVGKVEP